MAIDLTVDGKQYVRAALGAIAGLNVYGRKAIRNPVLPFVTVRKVAEEAFDYIDDPGRPAMSIIRVELRAGRDSECDSLSEQIDEAIRDGGRMFDRMVYFEGVETNTGSAEGTDNVYRVTVQYGILEV